ncbi:unnamed protein product [Caenorhabditis sp. 36 PRJEB53466]|nr:unnamed protein product [Caenorhabditis sp. 36 PRJEB53466]
MGGVDAVEEEHDGPTDLQNKSPARPATKMLLEDYRSIEMADGRMRLNAVVKEEMEEVPLYMRRLQKDPPSLPEPQYNISLDAFVKKIETKSEVSILTKEDGIQVKQVILEEIGKNRALWNCDRSIPADWTKASMAVYCRTNKAYTNETLRTVHRLAKDNLKTKLRTCILKNKLTPVEVENYLETWDLYPFFRYFRERTVSLEKALRKAANKNSRIRDLPDSEEEEDETDVEDLAEMINDEERSKRRASKRKASEAGDGPSMHSYSEHAEFQGGSNAQLLQYVTAQVKSEEQQNAYVHPQHFDGYGQHEVYAPPPNSYIPQDMAQSQCSYSCPCISKRGKHIGDDRLADLEGFESQILRVMKDRTDQIAIFVSAVYKLLLPFEDRSFKNAYEAFDTMNNLSAMPDLVKEMIVSWTDFSSKLSLRNVSHDFRYFVDKSQVYLWAVSISFHPVFMMKELEKHMLVFEYIAGNPPMLDVQVWESSDHKPVPVSIDQFGHLARNPKFKLGTLNIDTVLAHDVLSDGQRLKGGFTLNCPVENLGHFTRLHCELMTFVTPADVVFLKEKYLQLQNFENCVIVCDGFEKAAVTESMGVPYLQMPPCTTFRFPKDDSFLTLVVHDNYILFA